MKRFSPKGFVSELEKILNNKKTHGYRPDYNHRVRAYLNPQEDEESRSRHDGELKALEDSILSLRGLRGKEEIKQKLKESLENLRKQENFTSQTGWAQVDGKGKEKNYQYGYYSILSHILYMI